MNLQEKVNEFIETELQDFKNCDVTWNEFKEYKSGIYMLLQDDVVVYVGISAYYPQRITTHRKGYVYHGRKIFNRVLVHEVSDYHRALCLESYFIKKYKPKYNKNLGTLVDAVTYKIGFKDWTFQDIDKIILEHTPPPGLRDWNN